MFFITVFEHLPSEEKQFDLGDIRTVGYFSDYSDCEFALCMNIFDMHEGCYYYGVVEEIPEGICPDSRKRKFFEYDENKHGFFEIEEPECIKRLCGFAMG